RTASFFSNAVPGAAGAASWIVRAADLVHLTTLEEAPHAPPGGLRRRRPAPAAARRPLHGTPRLALPEIGLPLQRRRRRTHRPARGRRPAAAARRRRRPGLEAGRRSAVPRPGPRHPAAPLSCRRRADAPADTARRTPRRGNPVEPGVVARHHASILEDLVDEFSPRAAPAAAGPVTTNRPRRAAGPALPGDPHRGPTYPATDDHPAG